MQFAQTPWIFAGLVICAFLAIALHKMQKRRLESLEQFASAQLLGRLTRHISPGRRKLKNSLLVLAVFLLFVALARPQYGFKWVEVKRKGIDILFALDTSKSMLAEDTRPNRLQRAKFGILDFIDKLEGDRIGLMPFAGSSYLMCPLTLDYDSFSASLGTLSTDIIPLGGTNLSEVIRSAERVLSNDSNHKVLVLITDGEDLEGKVIEAAQKAGEKGMTIYTVGVGTADGELIPLPGPQGGFVKDADSKFVTSRLDESTLREIAGATGGIYAPLGRGGEGLETIYQQKLQLIPKEELAERRHKVPVERFSWPLVAAIMLLIIDYLIPERKGNGSLKPAVITTAGRRFRKDTLVTIFLAVCFATLGFAPPQVTAGEGEEAYAREDYLKASEHYREALKDNPRDPVLNYNFGTTAYKNNLFDQATASFTEALNSADLQLQQKAYFNLGNSLYRQGEEQQQANPRAAMKKWQQALDAYDAALQLNSEDRAASENHAYVEKKIEELQDQLKQQQDQQQQNQDQPEQQDGDSSNEQQPESQQGPQEQTDGNKQTPQEQNPQQSDSGEQQQPEGEHKDDTPGDDSANASTPEPTDEQATKETGKNDQQADAQRDLERRELGKMTREEAENLLNELKSEEGDLNFVPGYQGTTDNSSGRDW
ncbi:VWA domain-containing protein [Desulfosediminicola ganghwensis]|uniref:VWA domain-containing protein n=1 Tax=Desulfosediminicola ganghwensis TaxID=2569540 RepID=UPI0010AC1FAB|nr:VWA domain-containing protein [Desulfosediminicola ganghwensis]